MSKLNFERISNKNLECYYEKDEEYQNCNEISYPKKTDLEKKLRSYQKKTVRKFFKNQKNTFRVRMATGLGKSLIIYSIVQNIMTEKKIAIIVPLISILNEISTYFKDEEITLVGTNHNKNINFEKKIFICVDDSWEYISHLDFELVVFDESHHTYKRIREDLDESVKILELSATLKETKNKKLDLDFSLGWGIKNGYLNNYDLEMIFVSNDPYCTLVKNIIKRPEWLRIIGCCNSKKSLIAVSKLLEEYEIPYDYITSETEIKKRIKIISDFRKFKIKVLLNIGCLSEGCNIPEACTTIFFDSIKNSDRSIQRMGRVLRKSDKKDKSFVVIPVKDNVDENLELLDFIQILSRSEGCETVKDFFEQGKIMFTHENEDINYDDFEKEIENFVNKIYQNVGDGWELIYRMVLAFVNENCRLPKRTLKDPYELRLGNWCGNNKNISRGPNGNQERIMKLEKIPGWKWNNGDKIRESFEDKLERFAKYVEEYGKYPSLSKECNQKDLGEWKHTLKKSLKTQNPEQRKIYQEKIDIVNSKFPGFVEGDSRKEKNDKKWIEKFQKVVEYYEKNGKFPTYERKDGWELYGKWLNKQRGYQREKTLENWRFEMLNSKYPFWMEGKVKYEKESWMESFQIVKELYERTGRYPVPSDESYTWFHNQINKYRRNKLKIEKLNLMNLHLGKWHSISQQAQENERVWYENCENAGRYYDKYGKLPSNTSSVKEEREIGCWISKQNEIFTKKTMPRERFEYLKKRIPIWEPKEIIVEVKEKYTYEELNIPSNTIAVLMEIMRIKNIKFLKKDTRPKLIQKILEGQ